MAETLEENMNMWQDQSHITATFRGKKMDDKDEVVHSELTDTEDMSG